MKRIFLAGFILFVLIHSIQIYSQEQEKRQLNNAITMDLVRIIALEARFGYERNIVE